MAMNREKRRSESGATDDLDEKVVFVNRCAKTVKGGRRMSFSAVIVVGDHEVTLRVEKDAQGNVVCVTIPHDVAGDCDGGRVILKPAPAGTGLIVGGGMRPVLEAVGIRDAVGKSLGSKNRLNVVKATMNALAQLRSAAEIEAIRA